MIEPVKGSSDRAFGIVFAVFFALVTVAPLRHHLPPRLWASAPAALLAILAAVAPKLLRPLNRAWLRVGKLLEKITNPIVMGVLFFVVVTPAGLLMRLFGKDPLRLRLDREAASYWIERPTDLPASESMRNQF